VIKPKRISWTWRVASGSLKMLADFCENPEEGNCLED
jgi:hypothetical protein